MCLVRGRGDSESPVELVSSKWSPGHSSFCKRCKGGWVLLWVRRGQHAVQAPVLSVGLRLWTHPQGYRPHSSCLCPCPSPVFCSCLSLCSRGRLLSHSQFNPVTPWPPGSLHLSRPWRLYLPPGLSGEDDKEVINMTPNCTQHPACTGGNLGRELGAGAGETPIPQLFGGWGRR